MKKRFLKTCSVAILAIFCVVLSLGTLVGCSSVRVDSIEIVPPEGKKVYLGESFSLDFNVVPEEAKGDVKVKWKVDDSSKLSLKGGKFEALSLGSVKVTASVAGVTDEIRLEVSPPKGCASYSGKGYSIILPMSFHASSVGNICILKSPSYTYFNFTITEDKLDKSYFKATGSELQTLYEENFSKKGMNVTFTKPVTVNKETYNGVKRLRVECEYETNVNGVKDKIYQTQVIFNNAEKDVSCCLTVTYNAKEYDDSVKKVGEFAISYFLPI